MALAIRQVPWPLACLILGLLSLVNCTGSQSTGSGGSPTSAVSTTVAYTVDTTTVFPNPERGFFAYTITHSGGCTGAIYAPLDVNTLRTYRTDYVEGFAFTDGMPHTPNPLSLIIRNFCLRDYVTRDLDAIYLGQMQADFDTLRVAGLKAIVRLAYSYDTSVTPWDAQPAQMLRHLDQLQPVLTANADVISIVQLGFIGTWGEWWQTQNFADPSNFDTITAQNWSDRTAVALKALTMVPAERMVQVRSPDKKQRLLNQPQALTASDAYSGSALARMGHYNDCLLHDLTDSGTYSSDAATRAAQRSYLAQETLFLPMSGETCGPATPYATTTQALSELSTFHWSHLNIDYDARILSGWGAIIDQVKRNLGYRFALVSGRYGETVRPGEAFAFHLDLRNDGWAAPFNPRLVEVVLRQVTTSDTYKVVLPDDPRRWAAGTALTLDYSLCVPDAMPVGIYELLLALPDPAAALYPRAEYAIRLANDSVWEAPTGFNRLLHTVAVSTAAPATGCSSPLIFQRR